MKKILSILLAALLVFGSFGGALAEAVREGTREVYSGTCGADGDNLRWTLDTETRVLQIFGTGAMENYSSQGYWASNGYYYGASTTAPWYSHRGYIRSVEILDGVTDIGDYAFFGTNIHSNYLFSALTNVTISSSVMSIGRNAFNNCTSLSSVNIPDSITNICDGAFSGCTSLISATIGNGVMTIGVNAFSDCTSLVSATIGNGVTTIKGSAFSGCSSLRSVTIPDSVISIGDHAFQNCSSLTYAKLPNYIEVITGYTFSGCSSLVSLFVPANVFLIDNYAFNGCSSLTSVVFEGSVESIGDYAFANCGALTEAIFPGPTPSIGTEPFGAYNPDFCIYYYPEYASDWAPNGEATWHGYPAAQYYSYVTLVDGVTNETIEVQTVMHDEDCVLPEPPEHEGYTFSHWEGDYTGVTHNQTVTAVYDHNTHTVTYSGEYEGSETVFYGENAVLPVCPVEGYHYTFTVNGEPWYGTNVTGDLTVEVGIEINVYTVAFIDPITGEVVSEQQIVHGEAAEAPEAPEHEGYTFDHWDVDFSCITGDTTVTAVYNVNVYTVTFVGAYTGTQQVEHGHDAVLPVFTDVDIIHYTFTVDGQPWDGKNITSDVTVTVGLEINMYTVTFYDTVTGEVIDEQVIAHGGSATAPEIPEHYGYTFIEWDADFTNVTEDITVNAVYNPVKFTVTFTDGHGNTLSVQRVTYLCAATEPEPPEAQPGEIFIGWDADFSCITGNLTVNAVWQIVATCTVTFTGVYTATVIVNYGDDCPLPVYPSEYLHYTFMVDGEYWDGECVTSDVTVTVSAASNSIDCTVVFVDWDGTVLDTQTVRYGNAATPPADPVRECCVFAGWNKNTEFIAHDVTIMAKYVKDSNYLPGDVDCDGQVTMADVTLLSMYLNGENPVISTQGMYNADANDEWRTDIRDIAAIYAMIANS